MIKRMERTLQDLCDATPTLSQPQVTSDDSNSIGSSSDRIHKVDCRGRSGACNVCSAPCSFCFHVTKVLMKSNDESAVETCAQNIEVGQVSEVSTVAGLNSTSDSLSENAVGKGSSRTSNAYASDDSVVHSKSEGHRVPECHDDCLSCISGTDEHANRKSDTEDCRLKDNKQSKTSGEISDKVHPSSSPTGLYSQSSGMVEVPFSKNSDDASDLMKVQKTFSQASSGEYQNPRDVKDDKPSDTKNELLEGSTEHLDSLSARVVASDVVCGEPPATALNSSEKNDNLKVEVHPIDETDDSDMVEHDVKVCDICGDAGREDLLAICCRCSDGAEHTYCMREMLEKVPEGEWLCEECKTAEQVENERQEKIGRVDENEKNNSSGQASSEYINSSDVEGHRKKGHMRISRKRHRDDADAEVSSTAKKPAIESIVGLPKASNFSKSAALSRENSSKNLDKGRLQPSHNSSSITVQVNDSTESASSASDLRLHNFRGIFSKSNSFNSLNSKPKVKLVDQASIQRQKSATEHGSYRFKEGAIRSIGKSMSFKSTITSRSESKIKMLSPRLSHTLDTKNTKHRIHFERQRSFRIEQPSMNSTISTSMSTTSRIDKRPASRGESSSLTTIANHHEKKPVQTDGKSSALSKSSSFAARKTADLSNSLGAFKRPSIHSQSTPGILSASANNIEQKSYQTSLKEDSSPCHVLAERPSFNASEGLPDGLPRPRDLTNSGERMREYSGSRFGPTPVKSPRSESDNLKAAIEAAVLRKPGVYRKHRAFGQSDDSSVSSMGCEVAPHQDHSSNSAGKKKMSPDAELPEWPKVSQLSADSLKQETLNNVKQSLPAPAEGISSGGSGLRISPSLKDVFSNVPPAMPFLLKSLAVPEHEYIWQGSFEICRSGKLFHSWDGIQAHLSTCASPKVIEAVNKFESRIVLYEVPRLSTWPTQFQEHGVREDNIALFFFAKDLESYDKIYKVLLDNMMKNDLALKGNVNGVELLIFPSNELPDKSQRWNMLFFLWGVFRGKKESSLPYMPESVNQFTAPPDIPPPIMSLPENRCSLRPSTEDLFANEDAVPVLEVPATEALKNLLSSRANGNCVTNVSSLDQLESRLNSSSSTAVQLEGPKQCHDMRGIFQGGDISSRCSSPGALRNSSCSGKEQMLMPLDSLHDRQHSHYSSKSVAGPPNEGMGARTLLNKSCNQNQVKLRMDAGDPSMDEQTPLEDDQDMKDLNTEHNKWLFNHEEYSHPGSCIMSGTFYDGSSQVSLRNDDTHDETCGALTKNQREASVETLIPECGKNAERHFFPIESQPVKGICLTEGSSPWKMHLLEQDRLNDRAPNLELALGAERKLPTPGNRPLLVGKVDLKVNEEHIVDRGGAKEEDDVSASLSLSLSFPFHEKELSTKPAPKTGQLMSQRESVNTSMLLFRNLADN